jgi:hypothetical protein
LTASPLPLTHTKELDQLTTQMTSWPFIQREWKLQLDRKKSGRQGGYPGLFWAGTALSLPLLHQAMAMYGADVLPDRTWSYSCAALWLVWLSCLRACINCAVSMAEEVQHHAVGLVRHLPRSGGLLGSLSTKAAVVAGPLLFEWFLFVLLSLVLMLMGVEITLHDVGRLVAVGLSSIAFFCSLGMWLGARIGEPERAANNARVAVVMMLIGWALLENVLNGPILVIGALIWIALVFRSSRVATAFQGGVVSAVLILLIPQAYLLSNIRLYKLSPLAAATSGALTAVDCLLYWVGAALILLLNLRQLRRNA